MHNLGSRWSNTKQNIVYDNKMITYCFIINYNLLLIIDRMYNQHWLEVNLNLSW
jgi:hypothetical protein